MKKLALTFILIAVSIFAISCSDNGSDAHPDDAQERFAHDKVAVYTVQVLTSGCSSMFAIYGFTNEKQLALFPSMLEQIRLFPDSSACIKCFDTTMLCIANPFNHSGVGKSYVDTADSHNLKYFNDLKFYYQNNHSEMYFSRLYAKKSTTGSEYTFNLYTHIIGGTNYWLIAEYRPSTGSAWYSEAISMEKELVRNVVTASAFCLSGTFAKFNYSSSQQADLLRYFTHSPRFLDDNTGYLFVDDMEHMSISFPTDTNKEGTSLYDYTDSQGNYPVRMMVALLQTANCGWVEYYYTNPVTKREQKKHVYVQRIAGTNFFIGAGFYEKPKENE